MPTRSTPIDPLDLQGLALLANQVLLPQVNAILAANQESWQPHAYSIMDPVTQYLALYPQPSYLFDVSGENNHIHTLNRIFADYYNLVFNQPTSLIYQDQAALNSGPWVVAVNDPLTYPASVGWLRTCVNGWPIFANVEFWYAAADDTFNQMSLERLNVVDAFSLLFDYTTSGSTTTYTFNVEASITAPVTLAVDFDIEFTCDGNSGVVAAPSAAPAFTFSNTPAGGGITDTGFNVAYPNPSVPQYWVATATYHFHCVITFTPDVGANAIDFEVTLPPPVGPYAWDGGVIGSSLTVAATQLQETITAHTTVNVLHPASVGRKLLSLTNGIKLMQVGSTASGNTDADVRYKIQNPNINGIWVANTFPTPAVNGFIDMDIPPYVNISSISQNNNAVSESITFIPQTYDPANPHQAYSTNYFIQSSARQQAGLVLSGSFPTDTIESSLLVSTIQQSTQSQPAQWLVRRDTDFVPFELGFNNYDAWNDYPQQLATKDGSYNYYLDVLDESNSSSVGIKIRLCQNGSGASFIGGYFHKNSGSKAGWYQPVNSNGTVPKVFQYGQPLPPGLTIYISLTNPYPTAASHDYSTTSNSFTDGDGGLTMARINAAGNLFLSVANTLGAADVSYDLYIEHDLQRNPQRAFFPTTIPQPAENAFQPLECFSHSLDGTPWMSNDEAITPYPDGSTTSSTDQWNYIPTNGHCIYKIRATRMPVITGGIGITPGSGAALTVTVGQNKLLWDGRLQFIPFFNADTITPFTITIPANGRDTGDVDVFWPVLEGNEVIYQCSEQIIFEAWANWQPKFHFTNYGRYDGSYYPTPPEPLTPGQNTPQPTAWQYCLSFTNWYYTGNSNYPPNGGGDQYVCTRTQFPISVDIYNDMVNSLTLLQN